MMSVPFRVATNDPSSQTTRIGEERNLAARPSYLRPVPTASSNDVVAAELERIGTALPYARGALVIEEGNSAEYVFKVTRGALRSVRLLADGRRYITSFLLPDDFFGLADTTVYSQTVEAIADAIVIRYSRRSFEGLLERDARAGRHFLGLVCGELSAAQDRLLLLGRKSALERMAAFLLAMVDHKTNTSTPPGQIEIELPMNRSDVADYLGLTVETVSRLLSHLRSRRIIDLPTTNHVIFLDREALEDICAGNV